MGKGILYARRDLRVADPEPLARLGCRDIPAAGEAIAAGHPICTVIARAPAPAACRRLLLARAAAARRALRVKAPRRSW